ncbi:metalloregulator ArsR/SmtB family transcription factor [Pseudooceanicola sp. 216_PA32_1]|uniref:Metalloregulator ArsR/SmtB family transcription factor n=1 Tax=Pseudooceanicola pacificus TaxID=2676438 RepID=A0A844WGB6_9RHOB|nr:metalloregulator ArsR/SmtB family transcription factor [Pseudooceanicola pacificus]MWB78949.1 metalloregulator ArsR/SmtB family transcription factor [Pseudooceanicola pacificus]
MAKHDPGLDHIFTALGDPTRRAILARLAQGPASVTDLAAPFDMALPSFMGHLKRLEAAGLVASHKDGRVRTCALQPQALGPAADWIAEQRAIWEARLDRLDAFVLSLAKEQKE